MKFDIHYLFTAKYAKWIIISFICLFLFLIFYEYATLFFPLPKPPVLANSANSLSNKKNPDSLKYILTLPLYGDYVPDNLNEGYVKKSGLNVVLVGILLGDKPEDSQVIIRSVNGDEKTYKVTDKIPGEAVIKRNMAGGV